MNNISDISDLIDSVLESMADILVVTNPDETVRYVNQSALNVLGFSNEEINGIPAVSLFDDLELHLSDHVNRLQTNGDLHYKVINMLSSTGERIPVIMNGSMLRSEDGSVKAILLFSRDMREIYPLVTELTQLNEELEKSVNRRTDELRIAKEASDVALKKLQQTQAQLIQSDKMASIGQLSAGIAHEINNPTGFVLSNLKTLNEYISDIKGLLEEYDTLLQSCGAISDEDVLSHMKQVEEFKKKIDVVFLLDDIEQIFTETQDGMRRIMKIVKDLKEFSHTGSDSPEYADINKGLEGTLNIVWNEIKYKAEVKTLYGDIPHVLCYPQQLNQVFMNIFVNAAHAIESKGVITIRTFCEGDNVFVEISDTGCGISPEHVSRIFEPFFTTKPVGMGTGLGLSVAYAIIRKHYGDITVSSLIGSGTTFNICIPIESMQLNRKITG
ncbi:MAG: PAS domain S-box protein [Nitrospirae bacterium]|nr:PAS domain S-box protein [Nitrospirota bacterium]